MIITILRETATALNLDFGHGHEAYHNLMKPEMNKPYAWSLPVLFQPDINQALQLKTTYFPVMWFGKPHNMKATPLQLEEVTQEMEAVANAFLLRLANDPRVDSVTGARGEPDYHQLSMNATGVTIAFTVKLKKSQTYCP